MLFQNTSSSLGVHTIGDFYAHWQGLTPQQRLSKEEQWGYKGHAVRLIAKILEINESSVRDWGRGLNAKIPLRHQPKLALLLMEQKLKLQERAMKEAIAQRDAHIRQLEAQITRLSVQIPA